MDGIYISRLATLKIYPSSQTNRDKLEKVIGRTNTGEGRRVEGIIQRGKHKKVEMFCPLGQFKGWNRATTCDCTSSIWQCDRQRQREKRPSFSQSTYASLAPSIHPQTEVEIQKCSHDSYSLIYQRFHAKRGHTRAADFP